MSRYWLKEKFVNFDWRGLHLKVSWVEVQALYVRRAGGKEGEGELDMSLKRCQEQRLALLVHGRARRCLLDLSSHHAHSYSQGTLRYGVPEFTMLIL